jgi:hypothetical protein
MVAAARQAIWRLTRSGGRHRRIRTRPGKAKAEKPEEPKEAPRKKAHRFGFKRAT